jgi:hypothetical protein
MRQAACCVKVALRNQKLTWLLMMSCRNGSAQAPAVRDATAARLGPFLTMCNSAPTSGIQIR